MHQSAIKPKTEKRSKAVDEEVLIEAEEKAEMQMLINAIKILDEESTTKEEFLKELDRLLKEIPQ